jgi:hypothetical protein
MDPISQPATRPVVELLGPQAHRTDGVIDISDDEMEHNRAKESPAKAGVGGTARAGPTPKRKRKEGSVRDIGSVTPLRKKKKKDAAARSTPTTREATVHQGAGSTQHNVRLALEEVIVLSSEEDARLISRSDITHQLSNTAAVRSVAESSIGTLSAPADANTSRHALASSNLLAASKVGEKQTSLSAPEQIEAARAMIVEGPIVMDSTSTFQGDQFPQVRQVARGASPTVEAKKCLALRFFDSQPERRRGDGRAEKTRILDAVSWLTDLTLDASKAEVRDGGIVFTGEVGALPSISCCH